MVFPAVAALPGRPPTVMLAERSLPGSFIVDHNGRRFINESIDYMSYGQKVLERERARRPDRVAVDRVRPEVPQQLHLRGRAVPASAAAGVLVQGGIAHQASTPAELARKAGLPEDAFTETFRKFNEDAATGTDSEFQRGQSAYDRYYGDPTQQPNPNLRPLTGGSLYAVKMTLSDLGTCGGVQADERARVVREDGSPVEGLYAIGNTAANAFGHTYPGAGATIGQGLVFGYIAAHDAADGPSTPDGSTRSGPPHRRCGGPLRQLRTRRKNRGSARARRPGALPVSMASSPTTSHPASACSTSRRDEPRGSGPRRPGENANISNRRPVPSPR